MSGTTPSPSGDTRPPGATALLDELRREQRRIAFDEDQAAAERVLGWSTIAGPTGGGLG